MSVTLQTKGEERFQSNRHEFQDRPDEPGGKTGRKLRLTISGRWGDTSQKVVEFPILSFSRTGATAHMVRMARDIGHFELAIIDSRQLVA